jgi:hypothetical protein
MVALRRGKSSNFQPVDRKKIYVSAEQEKKADHSRIFYGNPARCFRRALEK